MTFSMKSWGHFIIVFLVSCGEQNPSSLKSFVVSETIYQSYINEKELVQTPNLQQDTFLANYDYPIEIALYRNGEFYYNLPNLGDGKGTWSFKEGKLKLFAERTLFNMHIDIFSRNEQGSELAISFSDRFGPKVLKVQPLNKQQSL